MLRHALLFILLPAMLGHPTEERPEGLPEPLLRQIVKDHYDKDSEAGARVIADGLEYREIDLNDDGSPELLVQGGVTYCGTAGCSLWIYRKTPSGVYALIYKSGSVSSAVVLFEDAVLKSKTNGFADLLFKDEPFTGGPYFQVLFFNGERYKEYSDW